MRRIPGNVGQGLRLAAMVLLALIAPALPRRAAFACARAMGRADAALTRRGTVMRAQLARSHGLQRRAAREAARDWVSNDYVDIAALARLALGRERPTAAELERVRREADPAALAAFLEGRPLIFALAHVGNATNLKLLAVAVGLLDEARRSHVILVVRVTSPAVGGPIERIDRLFRRLQDRACARISGRWGRVDIIDVGAHSASDARRLIRGLRSGGASVGLFVDAPWDGPGTYRRPFAGWASAAFSSGPAKLARAGGCPIVVTLPAPIDGEPWRLQPLGLIEPAAFASDAALLDAVLDPIERRVGERPTEYRVRPSGAGWQRRWDSISGRWA